MEYNTTRPLLSMMEYGRHIQKMVDYVVSIKDKDERQQQAQVLIELMGFLNPHLKNVEDFRHKLWDHLFYMSGFQLDVESPYPIPDKENYKEKPSPLPYPERFPKFAHLGKNLELLINKALNETDEEKKKGLTDTIIYYIKLAYSNWHKEQVPDDAIRSELSSMTHGRLQVDELPVFKYKPTIENVPEDSRSNNRRNNNYGSKTVSRNGSNNNRNNNNRPNNKNNPNNRNNNRPNFSNNGGNGNNNFKKRFK